MTGATLAETAPVTVGTEWMPHSSFSAAEERGFTACGGMLHAARRTPLGNGKSILEIECSACGFDCTTDDLSFRRAQMAPEQREKDRERRWWDE